MKIKTRESLKTIKTFDRAENLAGKTKTGISELNKGVEETQGAGYTSETEYAGNQVQGAEETGTRNALYGANRIGRWGVKETRRNIQWWRSRKKKQILSQPKELPAPKRQMLSAPKTADKTAKGAKTAQKTAKATLKASQKAAQAAKVAAKTTVHGIKAAGKATVAAVKATVAAVKRIIAAIAAGGWVAVVVILVIVMIGGVIAAVCDVFSPKDSGGYSVSYMMSACEFEYDARELEISNDTPHDDLVIEGQEASKKDVIAVFAVLTKSSQKDFSKLDSELLDEFRAVFFTMNTIKHDTSTVEETVFREYIDSDGTLYQVEETVTKTTLHIQYSSMTATEGADVYHFNRKQREQLNTLLSSDFDEMWAGILES